MFENTPQFFSMVKVICPVTVWVIALFFSIATTHAGQVSLAWNASTGPVGGYRIYYGKASGNYTASLDVGAKTSYTVTVQDGATYYFAVKAYDITRTIESGFSNEVSNSLGGQTVGLYNPTKGTFHLRNSNSGGIADITFRYGLTDAAGWTPLVGDWNGDGVQTVGLYNPVTGRFHLRNSNSGGIVDITFRYGPINAGWIPLVGDWNGDGVQTVGLYNPVTGRFHLRNDHRSGVADITFRYGPTNAGWVPLVGDWNGNGVQTVGLYNPVTGRFHLRNSNSGGIADIAFRYGPVNAGWMPLVGDYNGPGS